VGAASLASAFASLPAAVRADAGFFRAWAIFTGILLVPALALLAIFRAAREALRGERSAASVLGVLMWIEALFFVAMRFGAVLRAKTHHHALAGVTFALGTLFVAALFAVFAARAARWAEKSRERTFLLGAVSLLMALLVLRGAPELSEKTRAAAIDGAAALVALALGATASWPKMLAFFAPVGVLCSIVALTEGLLALR